MRLEDGHLILEPVRRPRRAGWADASRALVAINDDSLVWPEFGNPGDTDLKW
jgi:antitoxin MazE